MVSAELEQYGITVKKLIHNASPGELYEQAVKQEAGSYISCTGALMVSSGRPNGVCGLLQTALKSFTICIFRTLEAHREATRYPAGVKTGRSPQDKRIVEEPSSKDEVWYGTVNPSSSSS
jgi:phosphoenolpyruvate carboxykinase (ATP)